MEMKHKLSGWCLSYKILEVSTVLESVIDEVLQKFHYDFVKLNG